MNIVCFGLSHQTAEVQIRERFAFADKELPAATLRLRTLDGVREALILSTCNRVEHYAVLEDGPEPARRARDLFRLYCEAEGHPAHGPGQAHDEFFYHYDAPHSVEHLFRVACGLDSMVIGETEILGQVKRAYLLAAGAGTTSRVLNKLFQRAFQVSKQARSKTNIGRGSVSVASAAVDLAERLFGDLAPCHALILGAGETGERTARNLLSRGVRPESLLVANRSPERAGALAGALGGTSVPEFSAWTRHAGHVDILITSTSAPEVVVTRAHLETLMRGREDRPLFVIDIAVPRDVEPAANEVEGVYLYDIDSLQEIARQARESRQREMEACEEIIRGHVDEFSAWLRRSEQWQVAAAPATPALAELAPVPTSPP